MSNLVDVSLLLQFRDYPFICQEDAACFSTDDCVLSIPFTGK